jgi:hypothetical protein
MSAEKRQQQRDNRETLANLYANGSQGRSAVPPPAVLPPMQPVFDGLLPLGYAPPAPAYGYPPQAIPVPAYAAPAPGPVPMPVRTAHSAGWWVVIGWWWAPLYWLVRVFVWLLFWPFGLLWSWLHSRSKDRSRSRRDVRRYNSAARRSRRR